MPIASLRALGSASGDVVGAVANIVDYLEGRQKQSNSFSGPDLVSYYAADSQAVDGVGWWSGRGVNGVQLTGPVDPSVLAQVLLTKHPVSGEQMVAAAGSSGRAARRLHDDEMLSRSQTAERLEISPQRVSQLAAAGAERAKRLANGEDISAIRSWLDGEQVGRHWRFAATEVERYAATMTKRPTQTVKDSVLNDSALTVSQVADIMGVVPRRVHQLAKAGQKRIERLAAGEDASDVSQWLTGTRNGKTWTFERTEVERAVAAREQPRVVLAYDFTVSFEKSISVAWVQANEQQRAVIQDALAAGVQAGLSHLEDHGLQVRRGRGAVEADGVWAASYLHLTNRNLEPQLHVHTVIANVAADQTGRTQAIDARSLYRETTAAGYIAGAETRAVLTERLGASWDRLHKGTMEIADVPESVITAMSTRRAEVMALADELGYDTPKSRQVAALSTRASKQHPDDFNELVSSWQRLCADHGYGVEKAQQTFPKVPQPRIETPQPDQPDQLERSNQARIKPALPKPEIEARHGSNGLSSSDGAPRPVGGLSPTETASLFASLGSSSGLTKSSGVFSRSDIVQAVVMWDAAHGGGARLRASTIQDIADQVVGGADIGPRFTDHVVALQVAGNVAQRSAGDVWFTTENMLAIENAVIDAYLHGRGAAVGIDPSHGAAAIAAWESSTSLVLGADQSAMVREITSGTDQFGLVVGKAGAGKTAALEVAARAWEGAGLVPIGLAVTGSAADTLAASTGMNTATVASVLTFDDSGLGTGIGPSTVVIVDEASMLSNRDHLRLVEIVRAANARMIAIGDPAQHGAVEAGGLWSHLVESAGSNVSVLEVNHRQSAIHMTDIRLANDEIRNGEIKAAFARLEAGDRIVTAPTSSELFDRLAADFYVDLVRQRTDLSLKPSSMMAENHAVRRELIERAQTLLKADGTLTGDGVKLGESTFHVGERVITRTQHSSLRFDDKTKLRNAALGTVVEIHRDANGCHELSVAFDDKHTVRLDHRFLTGEIRDRLRGGLVPSYSLTTHTAQGQTMHAGRTVGTDGSSREAIYVGLSRGTDDGRLYVVSRDSLSTTEVSDVGLPVLTDTRSVTEKLEASLMRRPLSEVATALDPNAQLVAATARNLNQQHNTSAPTEPLINAARELNASRAARLALVNPSATVVAMIGERPAATDPARPVWDRAVTATVSYQHRYLQAEPFASVFDGSIAATFDPKRYAQMVAAVDAATRRNAATQPTQALAAMLKEPQSVLTRAAADTLDHRARNATATPAPYVVAVLGTSPTSGPERDRWIRAAVAIETYRHRSGLNPSDTWATHTSTARQAAIGKQPTEQSLAQQWRNVSEAIDRVHAQQSLRVEPPVRRTEPARRIR